MKTKSSKPGKGNSLRSALVRSQGGMALLNTIITSAAVTSILIFTPSAFVGVQRYLNFQGDKIVRESRSSELKTYFAIPDVCRRILDSGVFVENGNAIRLKSADDLFRSIRTNSSIDPKAPVGSEKSYEKLFSSARFTLGEPLFPGQKTYRAEFILDPEAGQVSAGLAYIPRIPIYIVFGAGATVQYCQLTHLAPDQSSLEDRICRNHFAATISDVRYNPLSQQCQSASGSGSVAAGPGS